ncbi:plasmid replication initiator TrfA [Nitrosospira multiformis]|uniref:TrfA protein n=1 Tax=Nitrosospira multiformis TaxID=1231 RepID=A0A1I7IQX2_9PROT|nr:plasmid replication initiator TrfA [Nitrosospira multiformis]SFU75335.1 TrfA protein [Nitrosospira multiformis]
MNDKRKTDTQDALQDIADRIKKKARENKRKALLADKQLTLWSEGARGIPNEIVRSALFTVRNRSQPRQHLKQTIVAVIGDGEITYTGEELRQDDETVWLQLIHLAKVNGLDTAFHFTPYSFCKAINWPLTGQSYNRLDRCLTRLQATSLKIYSTRLSETLSFAMLPVYRANRKKDGEGGLWSARMHDELVFLFSEYYYTRVEWQRRLSLPEGMATWLHAYYSSHKKPYKVKVETLAIGAGLIPSDFEKTAPDDYRLPNAKKSIIKALKILKTSNFLEDFEITRDGLVQVWRPGENDKALS